MSRDFTDEDAKLLEDLGVEAETAEIRSYTRLEERILAGFEEITRFVQERGRLPRHGADNDILERLYAVRLDRILQLEGHREFLDAVDTGGILEQARACTPVVSDENMTDAELLEALGVESKEPELTELRHVRPQAEKKAAAGEIAKRVPCVDFDQFKSLFQTVQQEIESGTRRTIKYKDSADYNVGDMFIVNGQMALVVEMSEGFVTDYDRSDRRLRVIYDNGTEAGVLLRSLQRALNRDSTSRRILDASCGPLFADRVEEKAVETGHIYVLRSESSNPFLAEHRDLIHKIGMTKGDLKTRLSGARKDPTFLLADVKLVASYALSNINPTKLENLLHSFFAEARLDVTLRDRFGGAVAPREWFMLPLELIDEAIELLRRGELQRFRYDAKNVKLIRSDNC